MENLQKKYIDQISGQLYAAYLALQQVIIVKAWKTKTIILINVSNVRYKAYL